MFFPMPSTPRLIWTSTFWESRPSTIDTSLSTKPKKHYAAWKRRSFSGCASPWDSSSRSLQSARTGLSVSTIFIRAVAFAPARLRSLTPAPCTASFPVATSTKWTTRSSRSCNAVSRKTPTFRNGPAASEAHGQRFAALAATSRAQTGRVRASFPSSNFITISLWP